MPGLFFCCSVTNDYLITFGTFFHHLGCVSICADLLSRIKWPFCHTSGMVSKLRLFGAWWRKKNEQWIVHLLRTGNGGRQVLLFVVILKASSFSIHKEEGRSGWRLSDRVFNSFFELQAFGFRRVCSFCSRLKMLHHYRKDYNECRTKCCALIVPVAAKDTVCK